MVAKNRRAKRNKGFLTKGIVFVGLIIGVFIFCAQTSWPLSLPIWETPQPTKTLTNTETKFTVPLRVADIQDTRFLELVNRDNPVNGKGVSKKYVSSYSAVSYRANDIELQETALEAVNKLFTAARNDGIKTLYVSSGFRSKAEQTRLYNEAADKSLVQPPNHSEHQTGLAVDIVATDVAQETLAKTREGRWLAQNSWKYGLILRYGQDKIDITQIAYEPWHFRYVGQPHAWYCQQNNLCLEEYIEFLRREGGYRAVYNGKAYTVVYMKPKDGKIFVPDAMNFSVSGDNAGGYVVTAVDN
ncbi:MAG: M15 family metallopeptidase [Peptococcaceae bacterium]|nr:M15 family metallopeptidase [Peptococcaceae bacterium]